jgi:hypothetical protein
VWECCEEAWHETEIFGNESNWLSAKHAYHASFAAADGQRADLVHAWNGLVENYAAAKLTHETDRIAAIAGMAITFREKLKLSYVSGIWKEHFPYNLLWYVSVSQSERLSEKRSFEDRPSWSWTSVQNRIDFLSEVPDGDLTRLAKILSWHSTPSKQEIPIFGELEKASVKIYGKVRTVNDLTWDIIQGNEVRLLINFAARSDEFITQFQSLIISPDSSSRVQNPRFLAIANLGTSGKPVEYGLVLVKQEPKKFARIGFYSFAGHNILWDSIVEQEVEIY